MQSTTATTPPAARARRTPRQYAGLVLRGMAMGSSDIVPGVSGGTMAFILGIYEELIDSIRAVGQPAFLRAVLRLQLKEALGLLNWQFLLAVATGILLAILTLSRLLEWLLVNHPVYLWSFFFGLVLASVFSVSKRVSRWTAPRWAALVVGLVSAYALVGLVPAQTPNAAWFLFLSGALAICAMILPGVSGAFILVLLGKYEYVLAAVNQQDVITMGLVAAGAAVGLVTFAQLLGWLLKRYHDGTVALLTGLMLGSLRKVWPWKEDVAWLTNAAGDLIRDSHGELIVVQQHNILPDPASAGAMGELGLALALAIIGFGGIMLLDRLASRHR